jgi:cell shape-determining protein MreC
MVTRTTDVKPKISVCVYTCLVCGSEIYDEIVTSNYSTLFPQGIPVGKVYTHSLDAGDNFHVIKVELSTNFSTLSYVYVIRNLLKEEQQTLENNLKIDN